MNYVVLIVTGALFGFFAALPIGPVNLICIRRTLQFGSFHGFVSGLGAAFGDGLFACIAGFGFTALVQLIVGYSNLLQLVGGLLLLFFGVRTFYTPPPPSFDERFAIAENGNSANGNRSPVHGMASTFVLAITNPVTLFGFTAFFATLGGFAGGNPSFFAAAFVVLGVFAGSALWWLTLTTVVGLLHARISDHTVRMINEISGAVVALFGVVVLGHLVSNVLGW